MESLKEPKEWGDWVEWVRDMGRLDQDAHRRITNLDGTKTARKTGKNTTRNQRCANPTPGTNMKVATGEKTKTSIKNQPDLGAIKEEKERWRKEDKCFRCGRANHQAKDCFATIKARSLKRAREKPTRKSEKTPGRRKFMTQGEEFKSRITLLENN